MSMGAAKERNKKAASNIGKPNVRPSIGSD